MRMKSRALAWLLILAMVISLLPAVAYAKEIPVEEKAASAADSAALLTELENGLMVYIYNPKNAAVLTANASGTQLVAATGTVEDEVLAVTEDMEALTVLADADGCYSFMNTAGEYLTYGSKSNVLTFEPAESDNSLWTVEETEGGFFVKCTNLDKQALEYYKGNFTIYSFQSYNNGAYLMQFFSAGGSAQPSNKVATPKATVSAGEVPSGTEVGFTCRTEGATILYKTTGDWTEYTEPITITEAITFTVKAVKEGMEDSKEVNFAYTIYVPPVMGEDQAQLVTDVSTLTSGDRIIIVTKDLDYSLGVTQKSNNRDYGNVVKAYDRCSYDAGTQIITLESGTEEGTFALYATNGDCTGYLYASPESGNLLRTQENKDINASFAITISADGTAQISSKVNKGANTIRYNSVGIFSCYGPTSQKPVCIYKLDGQEKPGLPEDGAVVMLYNLSAKGVVAGFANNEGGNIETAGAKVADGKAACDNGAALFKVEKNGEAYRFINETCGYLAAITADGLEVRYVLPGGENEANADWTVEEFNGGYRLCQAYGDSVAVLSIKAGTVGLIPAADVSDRDTVTFQFYPCANEKITEGIVNEPYAEFGNPPVAVAGRAYSLNFTVESVFPMNTLKVMLGETELTYSCNNGRYSAVIPVELIVGEKLTVTVTGEDSKGVQFSSSVDIEVNDEPVISGVTPLANSQTKEDKRPEISARLTNVGENPVITLSINGEVVTVDYTDGKVSYKPAADLADGRVNVVLTVTRTDGKTASKSWSFTVGEAEYILMFGQLHAHTGEYSDGSGTLDSALDYIANLPEDANVDFVAFTDHSNYFDKSGEANPEDALYDLSLATAYARERWTTYKNTIADFNESHEDILAIAGYEMTWSGGPGHMNTFVTEGIVSRNNTVLNNKSADAGMRAYYALLSRPEGVDSISQFNHPGSMFGNFTDFSYCDPVADSRIYLVEVGNGEGPVHGSGYYPSYEQYTLALDKGWHLAPTNNQDNHKAKWGNGNDARDVVLAEDFTEEAVYEAIRSYRAYSTEDRNLELGYYVNDLPMGTIIEQAPEKLNFKVTLRDPDSSDSIVKVELIVNSGKVAYTWDDAAELAGGVLSAQLSPDYSYYYVRVTQADGDLAVTAPVWVGESLKIGLEGLQAGTEAPVVNENVTLTATLYNNEASDAFVKSVLYTVNGSEIISSDNTGYVLSSGGTLALDCLYTPEQARLTNVGVTVIVEFEGKEYTLTASLELDVRDADEVAYIGIDASHNNEYVSGYNKDLLENFKTLAAAAHVRVEIFETSAQLQQACDSGKFSAIVLNVPSRRLNEAKDYSAEELQKLKKFNENGGMLIVTGGGDSNDKIAPHMAATQNALLESLGSVLRLSDDGTYEGSSYDLSLDCFGQHALTAGITGGISYYGGSTVYVVDGEGAPCAEIPEGVYPLVFANESTVSKDADNDGLGGNAPKYASPNGQRLLVMAVEERENRGMILVAGAAFMNDYDLVIPAENGNYPLCENLLKLVNPAKITDIAQVREQKEEGYRFTIEGVVTTNASGYDKETAFFDCIYVQDATGGINCFPVAGEFKLGDIVRVAGTTDFYQGEPELQVISIEKIGEGPAITPTEITAAQLNDRSAEGMLVTLKGTVISVTEANGLVESIYVEDAQGNVGRVFIDGYITATKPIENLAVGSSIVATGIASYDDTYAIEHSSYARIRVRDRGEIIVGGHTHVPSVVPGVAPGCTEAGLTEGSVCAGCGEVLEVQQVIPALGHDFANGTCTRCGTVQSCAHRNTVIKDAREATCTEDGYTGDICCADCGAKLYSGVTANALGHDFANGTCTRCNACQHLRTELRNARAATCTEDGYTGDVCCAACGIQFYSGVTVNALGHDYRGGICANCGQANPQQPDVRYEDVSRTAWYYDAVQYVSRNGLMNGVGNGCFEPEGEMTRAMVVTVLWRCAGSPVEGENVFADVEADQWYTKAVAWAAHNGVVNGVGEGRFEPDSFVTREQLAAILYRYSVAQGMNVSASADLRAFPDSETVSDYAKDALAWAVAAGLINGIGKDGSSYLAPQDSATRAQVAAILMRYMENLD